MRNYRKQAKILQAMSHPVRLQILEILARGPACVCDLMFQTRQRQAYISQHLMLLRQTGLVKSTRLGVKSQYELVQPDSTKNMLKCVLQDQQCKNSKQGETKMSTTPNNNAWHGIPREQIDWHPTVIAERCIGCGICATSCNKGVYAFDYEANKPVVVAPQACMVAVPPAPPSAPKTRSNSRPKATCARSSRKTRLSRKPRTCCAPTQTSTMFRSAHLLRLRKGTLCQPNCIRNFTRRL